jgi:hypothetical protein
MKPQFPPTIQSTVLGPLVLEENDWDTFVSRNYAPKTPQSIPGHSHVELIAWPPKVGISAPEKFVEFVERKWVAIIQDLDQILKSAELPVASAIASFCKPGRDYTPPTASELLNTVRLDMVKINTDGDHEIQLHDVANLVGGHDLLIHLDANLRPILAYFDG